MMPARTAPTVPANPEVLRWAREQMNLTIDDAARRLGITAQELIDIESRPPEITSTPASVVRKMESVYKRTRSVLLLPTVPPPRGKVALRTGRGTRPSETTLLAIRDIRRVQRFVTDIIELDRELFPLQNIGEHERSEDPEEAANVERARLGPSVSEQKSWRKQAIAVDKWRDVLMEHGVAVTKKSMPWNECRGVSVASDGVTPFIVVNTQDTMTAMCFTMWHEYAHIVLGEGSACGLGAGSDDEAVERWCNEFAAAYLMPRDEVRAELMRPPFASLARLGGEWTLGHIQTFARRFKVSPLAAARRLLTVANVPFYNERADELWQGEHANRPEDKDGGGGELAEVRAVREYGVPITEAIIEAVHRGIADPFEAGQAIGVMASRFGELEAEMNLRA